MADNDQIPGYADALKYELKGARRNGNKEHEAAVLAELKRVGSSDKETTSTAPAETA